MEKERLSRSLFDLFVVFFIVVAGLFTAYVTFGILQSQAEAEIQRYSVGGAIAGALVTMSLLTSIYLQIRKSSQDQELETLRASQDQELQTLRDRNQELQQKLIRGAPRPAGFEIEVAEQQRIVLARPNDWERRGGVIFDFELPEQQLRKGDVFPARFTCSFVPITAGTEPKEQFYSTFQESALDNPYVESHTSEFVYLGGEPRSIKSLKMIAHQYISLSQDIHRVTGKVTRSWNYISKDDFNSPSEDTEESVAQSKSSTSKVQEKEIDDTQKNQIRKSARTKQDKSGNTEMPVQPQSSNVTEQTEQSGSNQSAPQDDGLAQTQTSLRNVEVLRMLVVCYHEELKAIFYFEFLDDDVDFAQSSSLFNQILSSTRFLT